MNMEFKEGNDYIYNSTCSNEVITYNLEKPSRGKGLLLMFNDGRYDINLRMTRGSKKRNFMYKVNDIEELKQLLKDAETRLYKVIIED